MERGSQHIKLSSENVSKLFCVVVPKHTHKSERNEKGASEREPS